jgi:2,3-bisphosphoglycerate-independent phosphoglycerate mutase
MVGFIPHTSHLRGLIAATQSYGLEKSTSMFTDGRDVDPKSGKNCIQNLQNLPQIHRKVASIIGRYYAMDRDKDGSA